MPSAEILKEKQAIVEELANDLSEAKSIVFSAYQGLTVDQDTQMRSAFRKENLKYRVVKNTISTLALEKIGITGLEDVLKGPTALAWSVDDVVMAPRMVKKFVDEFKKTEIKGGIVEGKVSDLDTINALANIPPQEVLYGQLVSALIFPVTSLAMTLNAMAKKAEEENVENVADLVVESKPAEDAPAEEKAEASAEEAPAEAKAEASAEESAPEAKAEEAAPAEEAKEENTEA